MKKIRGEALVFFSPLPWPFRRAASASQTFEQIRLGVGSMEPVYKRNTTMKPTYKSPVINKLVQLGHTCYSQGYGTVVDVHKKPPPPFILPLLYGVYFRAHMERGRAFFSATTRRPDILKILYSVLCNPGAMLRADNKCCWFAERPVIPGGDSHGRLSYAILTR